MSRGEVFWSEQRGRRPVIVVSNDGFNLTPSWRSTIVVPISTSAIQARRGPTAIALPAGVGGLPRASVALCHQVTTLDRSKLTDRLGALPPALLAAVDVGLKAALDLD
jgi:mRNA interferase MazF